NVIRRHQAPNHLIKAAASDAVQRRGYRFPDFLVRQSNGLVPWRVSCLVYFGKFVAAGHRNPARETHALRKFVFVRVNSWFDCAKQILWSSLVDCHCIDCRRTAGVPDVTWGSLPGRDLVVTNASRSIVEELRNQLDANGVENI